MKIYATPRLRHFLGLLLPLLLVGACKKDDDTDDPVNSNIPCTEITSSTTLLDKGEGIDYFLDCDLVVSSRLTIAAGVTIHCKANASIVVENGGALVISGTAASPVTIQGAVAQAGYWKGIRIRSNSPENEINYCSILHAGSASFDGLDIRSAIRISADAQLKLRNSTIGRSARHGLFIEGQDTESQNPLAAYNGNTFSDNASYPISCIAPSVSMLDGTNSSYTGNGTNAILIRGGKLFGDHVWKKMAIPYHLEAITFVGQYSDNGSLTIDPGCTLLFAGDAGLCTGEYSTGSWLHIEGTALEPITLSGIINVPGYWKGLAFQSTSPMNNISYCDIRNGGSSSYTGNTAQRANIRAGSWSPGSFSISNSSVSGSSAYGIYATLPSPSITLPADVSFSNNASGNYYHE